MSIELKQLDTDEILRYMGCPPGPGRSGPAKPGPALWPAHMPDGPAPLGLALLRYTSGGERRASVLRPAPPRPGPEGPSGGLCKGGSVLYDSGGSGGRAYPEDPERRYAPGLALDCAADTAVEQGCDQIELELQAMFPGCSFPFRYSPGYGDLPLTVQGELLSLLDAPRRVGLTASASHILIPRKSVTAILGVSDREIARNKRSCLGCPAQGGCQYRKAGGHCGLL